MQSEKTLAERALTVVHRGEPVVLGELDGDAYVEIPALVAHLGSDGGSVDIIGLRAGWEGTPLARFINASGALATRPLVDLVAMGVDPGAMEPSAVSNRRD